MTHLVSLFLYLFTLNQLSLLIDSLAIGDNCNRKDLRLGDGACSHFLHLVCFSFHLFFPLHAQGQWIMTPSLMFKWTPIPPWCESGPINLLFYHRSHLHQLLNDHNSISVCYFKYFLVAIRVNKQWKCYTTPAKRKWKLHACNSSSTVTLYYQVNGRMYTQSECNADLCSVVGLWLCLRPSSGTACIA